MEQLDRDDAIGFYRRFYAPNDAIVVVAGDIEPDQARKFAEETYGKLPANKNIVPRRASAGTAARGGAFADACRPARRAADAAARLPGAVVSQRQARPVRGAWKCCRQILGTGENSRLYRALVADKHVAVAAGAYYDSSAIDMSKFGVYGVPQPGTSLPQLEGDIDGVIADGHRQRHRRR